MNPQDQYLNLILRLDWIQSMINALKSFYDAPTEAESITALAVLRRLKATPPYAKT